MKGQTDLITYEWGDERMKTDGGAQSDFRLILRVWEILPTSKNAFCVYKCTACQVVNIEMKLILNLRKNKAKKRMPIIKLYIGMALRRLKKISNIKPFSSVFFHFYGFEWNMVQPRTV